MFDVEELAYSGAFSHQTHTHTKVVDGFIIYTYYICAKDDAGCTWMMTKILRKKNNLVMCYEFIVL